MTEDLISLWEGVAHGDEAAREQLLLKYFPLVELLAKRIARIAEWANVEDLVQDGFIGLMQAVSHFDHNRGTAFESFAKLYIRGAIFDSSDLTRDLARRQQEISSKVRRAEAELTKTLGRQPTIEEVAEQTNLKVEQIQNALDALGVAFARELPDDEEAVVAPPAPAAPPETAILAAEALSRLSERAALIVIYYYLEGQSAQEIADRLGLTTDNVTKIRQRAIRKLRKLLG
jgi:RNA polymerase sigma factor (sigma-70 family)